MMELRNILVATDFSPAAEQALDTAIELARENGGRLTLLHVCEMPPYSRPAFSMYVPSPEQSGDIIAAAQRGLDAAAARCAAAGIAAETAWVAGAPAGEIIRFAAAHEVDVIVVGSHGRGGFRRLMLGSVADTVVRGADRPVLTVHEGVVTESAGAHGAA
jgi:nucleotide-binding universal stress UspA family protein